MTKVVKFGGTSLAEAKQFLKVADIIRSDPDRRYVVPSAPGKRFSGDTKVTDMFYYEEDTKQEHVAEVFDNLGDIVDSASEEEENTEGGEQ